MSSNPKPMANGLIVRRLLAAAILLATSVLAGCGGGGTTLAGGGTSGTGITQGSVTGFGSVIVNGVHFDTDNAEILVEGDRTPNGEADLAVGMVVTIRGSWDDTGNGVARSVAYDDDLRGAVEGVDAAAGTFVVLGRTVRVTPDTVFDAEDSTAPFNGLADMSNDQVVEVSGYFEGSGDITASRVALKDGNGEVEIKGRIEGLNDSGGSGSFQLGSLTVSYDTGTEVDEEIDALANDLFVEVRGTYDGSTLSAGRIEREDDGLEGDEGEEASIEGLIANKTSPTDFTINGQAVRVTADTEYDEGRSAADLVEGAKIEAEGTLVVIPSGTVLVADEIDFRPSGDIRLQDRVSTPGTAQFTTSLGITVVASPTTILEDDRDDDPDFGFSRINQGDFMEVRGVWDAGRGELIATRVERDDPEDGCSLRGPASNVQTDSLTILTVAVNVSDPAEVIGIGETDIVEASTNASGNCTLDQMNDAEVH